MWFRHRIKNRRSSRSHDVLDVKLRSSQVRSARVRLATIVAGVFLGSLLALYLFCQIGRGVLNLLVYENQSFAVQRLEVQSDGVISPDQLRRWSGVNLGDNLFVLKLDEVKRGLEMVSMIHSVSVERILPDTLRIRVTERVPLAQVNVPRPRASGGGIEVVVFQVDSEGFVMQPLDPRQRAVPLSQSEDKLPVLSGINVSELQPGRRVDSPQVRAALQLITAYENTTLAGMVDLKRVDVAAGAGVLVATTEQGSEVTLSLDRLDQQLLRWQRIHEECLKRNKIIAALDLAVSDSVPLRFLEASAVPPVAPKAAKPSRPKKKNV
jgi:cell division septal protein FtsQ